MPTEHPTRAAGLTWITGASSGLGQAAAIRYARLGRMVAASARSVGGIDDAARLAAERGALGEAAVAPIRAVGLDVTDRAAVGAAVARIEDECGPIGMALLNAGTHEPVSVDEAGHGFDAATFRRLIDINVMGVVHAVEALVPRMAARRGGTIAIVSSVAGYRGLPTASAYGLTKAGLINMAEALRIDLARCGIDVRLVCPGFVRTPLTDRNKFRMPFLMDVDEAAKRLVDGLDRPGGFEVTFPRRFTWQIKLLRLLPYALYFPLVRRSTT